MVWLGQIISVLATNMSNFALTIWVFEKTGSATSLGLMQFFFITPFLAITPIAGVMVDRHDRKLMMAISDLAAGAATVAVLLLQVANRLEIWHLYAAAALMGLGNAFQWPAFSAAISVMVPREQYGRADGMMSLAQMGPGVFAPMLAGGLLPLIGLTGILTLDVVTFVLAILALAVVHIPAVKESLEGKQAGGSTLKEATFGFRYIFARPSLLGLQLVFLFSNLCMGVAFHALSPMILLHTGNNSMSLGTVLSAGAVGGVAGGVLMSLWGGFKQRVHGVLGGWIVSSFFFMLAGSARLLPLWIAGVALSSFFGPLIDGSNQAIWQSKVPPDLQGRVFSARMLIAWIPNPIAPLITGLLGDYVLEPAMRSTDKLAGLLSWLVVPGPGAGMQLLIIAGSLGGILAGAAGYFSRQTRNAETLLPEA